MLKIYTDMPNHDAVAEAVDAVRGGAVLIIPTGTGYAFACDALQQRTVERIALLKGKDVSRKALSIMCENISQAAAYCRLSEQAYRFVRDHQGFFTFILPPANKLPKAFKARKEVGLRLAMHPIASLLIAELGLPLMVGSLSSEEDEEPEYATDPELIEEKYADRVDIVIDGGIAERHPSTIINCLKDGAYYIVRQGEGEVLDKSILLP